MADKARAILEGPPPPVPPRRGYRAARPCWGTGCASGHTTGFGFAPSPSIQRRKSAVALRVLVRVMNSPAIHSAAMIHPDGVTQQSDSIS